MIGGGPAAATDDVEETTAQEVFDLVAHVVGRLVVLAELVGQSGVGIRAHEEGRFLRELFDVRAHLLSAERAIQSNTQQVEV